MPRPKRPHGQTERLELRVSPLDKKIIESDAEKAGLTISEFVRRRALGVRVLSSVDDDLINELRRLGGLQKHLSSQFHSHRAVFDHATQELIAAIHRVRR